MSSLRTSTPPPPLAALRTSHGLKTFGRGFLWPGDPSKRRVRLPSPCPTDVDQRLQELLVQTLARLATEADWAGSGLSDLRFREFYFNLHCSSFLGLITFIGSCHTVLVKPNKDSPIEPLS